MTPGAVLIDFNRRTAVVVGRGRKLTRLVALEEGELIVRTFSLADLELRGFRPLDYPVKCAVRKFLQHAGGVSGKARSALNLLRKGK